MLHAKHESCIYSQKERKNLPFPFSHNDKIYRGVTEAVNLNRVVKENQAKYSTMHVIINIAAPI